MHVCHYILFAALAILWMHCFPSAGAYFSTAFGKASDVMVKLPICFNLNEKIKTSWQTAPRKQSDTVRHERASHVKRDTIKEHASMCCMHCIRTFTWCVFDHQAEWSQCSSEGRARFELGGTVGSRCVCVCVFFSSSSSTALFGLRSCLASTTVGLRAVRRKLTGHAVQERMACIHQHLGKERHGTIV